MSDLLSNKPPTVAALRRAHHLKALLVAIGREIEEVAAICDTTMERLEHLSADPSFREIIAYYRNGGTFMPSRNS
jgi:hypothetical protein